MRLRDLVTEWSARRVGRRKMKSDLPRSARDIIGPTGWMWSKGWDELARHQATYVRSFDRRVPPSLFLASEERSRQSIPIPLAERMIEEHGSQDPAVPKPDESD